MPTQGPAGSGDYVVCDGDCIASIASAPGHFWETVWNDSANAELKEARGDPNVLLPGDRVTVPPLREKEESCGTEATHAFRRKGVPAKFRMRLLEEPDAEEVDDDPDAGTPRHENGEIVSEDPEEPDRDSEPQPRANVDFILTIDGKITEGQTDGDGYLEVSIPPGARSGKLTIAPATERAEEIEVQLGHLAPLDSVLGVKQRLANLGFDCGDRSDELTEDLHEAIAAFQDLHDLEATGELDDTVRAKIEESHGS